MAPIPVEHSYIVPTGQTYYQPGQQQMYSVGQYGHDIYGQVYYIFWFSNIIISILRSLIYILIL